MSLFTYQNHVNLTDHLDFFAKWRTFLTSNGWTEDDYQANVQWGATGGSPPFDWISGSNYFLQVSSTGYGSQDIKCRFYLLGTGDANNRRMYKVGASADMDTTKSNQPWEDQQNSYYANVNATQVSFPPYTIPEAHFYTIPGKFWVYVVKVSSNVYVQGCFGSVELYDTSETQAIYDGTCHTGNDPDWTDWEQFIFDNHLTSDYLDSLYYQNTKRQAYLNNWWGSGSDGNSNGGFCYKTTPGLLDNQYTNIRTLFKPIVFTKRDGDGNEMTPVGTLPFYHVRVEGHPQGKTIINGSEKYHLWHSPVTLRKFGMAIRYQ